MAWAVVESPVSGASCFWRGSQHSSGDTWRNKCNTCRCQNGIVSCTKLWCGAGNCIQSVNDVLKLSDCGPNQVSYPLTLTDELYSDGVRIIRGC